MKPETIDHSTLSTLVEAGAVQGARIVAQGSGWSVLVKYGVCQRSLAAQKSRQVRLFRKLDTLVAYLKEVGIARFEVDAANFNPLIKHASTRPDRSVAMKRTHAAAAYDSWFREQVQISLDDPRPSISAEDAKTAFAQRKAALKASVK